MDEIKRGGDKQQHKTQHRLQASQDYNTRPQARYQAPKLPSSQEPSATNVRDGIFSLTDVFVPALKIQHTHSHTPASPFQDSKRTLPASSNIPTTTSQQQHPSAHRLSRHNGRAALDSAVCRCRIVSIFNWDPFLELSVCGTERLHAL